jgi:hypothetical protein
MDKLSAGPPQSPPSAKALPDITAAPNNKAPSPMMLRIVRVIFFSLY